MATAACHVDVNGRNDSACHLGLRRCALPPLVFPHFDVEGQRDPQAELYRAKKTSTFLFHSEHVLNAAQIVHINATEREKKYMLCCRNHPMHLAVLSIFNSLHS